VATKQTYSDDDKGRVFFALTVNQGNVKRTHRDTGVPISTIRGWKKEWEAEGPSTEVALAAGEQAETWLVDADRVRNKALAAYEDKVDAGEVSARDLMTGFGILSDKMNAAKGLKKKPEAENKPGLEAEIAKALVEALQQSQERQTVVYAAEAEWEQVDTPSALPEPEEETNVGAAPRSPR
jgi:hypothetical protein